MSKPVGGDSGAGQGIEDRLAKLSRVESGASERRLFVLVREREIKELQLALEARNGSKRTFQTLPRFERRRIMSHNIHVLPKQLRAAAQKELQLPARVQQRKRRKMRRRKILKLERHRLLSQDSPLVVTPRPKRLATHIFHAKRMHMATCWGFRVAIQSALKIYRVAYRFIRQHATIHDASYLVCLQLEGSKKHLVSFFSRLTVSFAPRHEMYTGGAREGSFVMNIDAQLQQQQQHDFPCLGPVKFLWRQQQVTNDDDDDGGASRSCWMWIHPASIPQAYPLLQRISREENVKIVYRSDLCRFEIRGPCATLLLRNPAHFVPNFNQSTPQAVHAWRTISKQRIPAGSLPRHMVLQLVAHHPQCSTDSIKQHSLVRPVVLDTLSANTKPLVEEVPHNIAFGDEIWCHMRNNESLELQQQEGSSGDIQMKDDKKKKADFSGKTTSVILVQVPPAQGVDFGGGWDFICSLEVAANFWSKFAHAKHVLPLPIYDRNRLLTEQGLDVFPDDYPDSKAYYDQMIKFGIKKHRKPVRSTHISYPETKWKQVLKIPSVSPISVSRTLQTCDTKKPIPLSTSQLCKLWIHCPYGGTPQRDSVLYRCKNQEEYEQVLATNGSSLKHDEERVQVGFVTSGIYSLSMGQGFGVAQCFEAHIQQVVQYCTTREWVLLMQNPGAKQVQPVLFELYSYAPHDL